MRFKVDFPEPFGPTSATRLPGATSNETPSSATTRPKRLRTPWASIRMPAPGPHAWGGVDEDQVRLEDRHDATDRLRQRQGGRAAEEGQRGLGGEQVLGGTAELVGHVAGAVAVEVVARVVVEVVADPLGVPGVASRHLDLGTAVAEGVAREAVPARVAEEAHRGAVQPEGVALEDVAVVGPEGTRIHVEAHAVVDEEVVADHEVARLLEPQADPRRPPGIREDVVAHDDVAAVHDEEGRRV